MLIKETKEMSASEARACRNTNAAYLRSIALPVGAILDFAGETVPNGALLCDGRAVSRTLYSELFAVIGAAFGNGDGETTFNLPNLSGRVSVGIDTSDSDFSPVGKTGGEKKHTLTADEIPEHTHEQRVAVATDEDVVLNTRRDYNNDGKAKIYPQIGTPTAAAGGGQPHNNMPPYLAVKKIIVAFGGTLMDENGVLKPIWEPDETYDPNSLNAQSGKAVSEAVENAKNDIVTAENQGKSNALKGKSSGTVIQLSGVSPVEHTLNVKLTSEAVTDFSEIKVIKSGKNLLNVPENLTWTGVYTVNTYLPAGTYRITYSSETHEGADVPTLRLGTKSYNVGRKEWIVTLTAPQTVIYLYTNGFNANASKGVSATVNQWMISLDGGEYEPYKAPTEYTPNADGTVEGIKSVYPTTTLMTDTEGVTVNAEYNRDINKAFAELQQAIISLGGNV